jgi:DNA-binding response OmpR family regulator
MQTTSILVVEDNHELAASLEDILNLRNYKVTIAKTGREGLTYAMQNHPDLIILDIRLPDMSGYEIYHKLQTDVWGRDAKVLVLTASEAIEDIAKNIKLPLKYILFKPDTNISKLLETIQYRLKN